MAERGDVHTDGLSVTGQFRARQLALMREEALVHGPERAAVPGAVGRLGGLEGVGVDGLERKIANHVPDAPGLDVRLLDLGHRLTDVPRAKRSLVVRELHDDDRRLRVAHRR